MSFAVGSLVKARGREWVVLPESAGDLLVLRPLGGTEDEIAGILTSLEEVAPAHFDLPDPRDPRQIGDHRSARLLRDAVGLGFRSSAGPFRSFAGIAVEPRPYQLVPLLMALKLDPVRLLIADDVGIGKTIEAGLIAKELLDRGEVERLAVLCPPALAEQWQAELREKFHIEAELVLASTVARLERNLGMTGSLFEAYPFVLGDRDDGRRGEVWNADYVCIFHMTNDSGHFRRREELESMGLSMDHRRRFIAEDEEYWPLYEGKYMYLMDHRYGTFENVPVSQRYGRKAPSPTPTTHQLADPYYEVVPRYWFPLSLWKARSSEKGLRSDFQFHFRDVAGVYPDLRTAIGAICPAGPAGNKAPTLTLRHIAESNQEASRYLIFLALFDSLPFDYVVRNKLFSKSLNPNVLYQLPMPPPSLFELQHGGLSKLGNRLASIALELTFTSWSLASLGAGRGVERPFGSDAQRRFELMREVDAIAAHTYGLTRSEFEYVLSTFETLAQQERRTFGDCLTARVALAVFDQDEISDGDPDQAESARHDFSSGSY